ncbi:adenylyltransferase/cytidyltransferase family protein [Haloactinomyces albus]|uniref:Cytidyltransferase-like protein n=1 Tax=Haloactinomyces albus TaxID=1352928 RepID=A0AAE3ZII3_9ACTN|nr:adenylyltransferase/cytidyltransferase family protein [Haloactinomyces albus]MDR7303524.1 cytidyltransferase-like protein [Haloactinomyces albus]
MTKSTTFIWEGRFQPIHRGHVAYVRELLKLCDDLIIVVVANEVSEVSSSPVPEFSAIVDEHHRSENNPWPLWQRRKLVSKTLTATFPEANITVLAGHRLDLDWNLYDQLLPPDRVFAVPTRDDFEDAKAEAWTSLGERVHRVDTSHVMSVSGTLVRERMQEGKELESVLEPITAELISSGVTHS